MSNLSADEVKHLAALAKINLTPGEIRKYQRQLTAIVNYVSALGKIATDAIAPTSQTTGLKNVFRIDEIKPEDILKQEDSLSGVDNSHNGYFVVEAVLNKASKDK